MDPEHYPIVRGPFLNIFEVRRVSHGHSAFGYGATLVLSIVLARRERSGAKACGILRSEPFTELLHRANEKREKFPSRACRRYVSSRASKTIRRLIARKSAVTSIRITIMGTISLFVSPWPPTG
jgi:hypothetical protein